MQETSRADSDHRKLTMSTESRFMPSCRFMVTILCFWSVANMMYLRLNMSVAIVCMVNHTQSLQDIHNTDSSQPSVGNNSNSNNNSSQPSVGNNSSSNDRSQPSVGNNSNSNNNSSQPSVGNNSRDEFPAELYIKTVTLPHTSLSSEQFATDQDPGEEGNGRCVHIENYRNVSRQDDGPIKWDTFMQGQVLAAYFYGYAVSKLPTGLAVPRVGGKILILISSLVASVTCLLTPVIAEHSYIAVAVMRVLLGVCGGMVIVSVQSLLNNWSPPLEKSMMGAYTFAGFPCGTLAAFVFAGLLCEHGFAGGWPSVFYTFGMSSLAFCLMWACFVTDSPSQHPYIRNSEKLYILDSLLICSEPPNQTKPARSVPWASILTSPPVYAVVACAVCTDFVGNVLLLYLPTYLAEVMNFDISSSGLLSALPYVFCFLALALTGHLSDVLIKHTTLSLTAVRKFTVCLGMLLCVVSLLSVSFMGCHQAYVAVTLLVIGVTGIGFMTIGYFVNPMDIAREYAGAVVGVACVAGDVSGFISPSIVAAITSQGTSQESWQTVFLMSAAVAGFCFIFYLIFASGELQSWAKPSQDTWSSDTTKQTTESASPGSRRRIQHESSEDSAQRLLK